MNEENKYLREMIDSYKCCGNCEHFGDDGCEFETSKFAYGLCGGWNFDGMGTADRRAVTSK